MEIITDGYSVVNASVTKEQLEKIEKYNKFRIEMIRKKQIDSYKKNGFHTICEQGFGVDNVFFVVDYNGAYTDYYNHFSFISAEEAMNKYIVSKRGKK